jgi:uncharacterized protein DUF4911
LPYRNVDPEALPEPSVRYFKVDRHDLVYLKFVLEAYEGMSTLSTVEPKGVIVRLSIPSGFEEEMRRIIEALSAEIPLTEVEFEQEDY